MTSYNVYLWLLAFVCVGTKDVFSKTDPGVPNYAGFGAVMLKTCISCPLMTNYLEISSFGFSKKKNSVELKFYKSSFSNSRYIQYSSSIKSGF